MRRHRLRSAVILLAAATLVLLAAGSVALAQPLKEWRIDNIDVVLDVQQNGDVIVDETYTYTFAGNYHWVARDIPTAGYGGITDIQVRNADGIPLPEGEGAGTFKKYKSGDLQSIEIYFDLTDTSATYTYHYRAKNVILFWEEGDELRWYVFDAATAVPVGAARATVKLPGSIPIADMTHSVQTGFGVQALVDSPAASTMVYEAADIPPYTNFWIVTGFPKGVVKYTWTARRLAEFLVPKIGFLLPIISLLAMLLIWRKRGRDEPGVVHATYVSEPPSDLSPGLAGALIDEKVDTKEVIATIVDLSRRGYMEITDTDAKGPAGKAMTIFTRRKSFDDLKGFEKKVAESLFDSKHPDQVTTKDLKNHFYKYVEPIVDQVYEDVTTAGLFFKNPKKARARWFGYGFAVAVVLAVLTFIMYSTELAGFGWFMLGSIVAVIIIWVFAPHMPQRTPRGAQEQRRWEAFKNYLRDLTRFQEMQAAKETFEKYLPYAIAFGVEKEWVRRFEGVTVSSPDWYHPPVIVNLPGGPVRRGGLGGGLGGGTLTQAGSGPGSPGGGFSLDTISDGLFKSLSNMSNVLTAVPSSKGGRSGGGAWGGGGFSGGGGGGGSRAG